MRIFLVLIAVAASAASFAQLPHPPAPAISARSFLLLDVQSRQELAGQKSDERVEPASLTKLMTAYLTFAALKQKQIQSTQVVPVSERAWKIEGSRMFIEPGKPVTVDELMRGMIVQSGNDACIALAELIAGAGAVHRDGAVGSPKQLVGWKTDVVSHPDIRRAFTQNRKP